MYVPSPSTFVEDLVGYQKNEIHPLNIMLVLSAKDTELSIS